MSDIGAISVLAGMPEIEGRGRPSRGDPAEHLTRRRHSGIVARAALGYRQQAPGRARAASYDRQIPRRAGRSTRLRGTLMSATPAARPRVGLFVTCLVDLFRPSSASRPSSCCPARDARCAYPRRRPAAGSPPTTRATGRTRAPRCCHHRRLRGLRLRRRAVGLLRAACSRRHYPALVADDAAAEAKARAFADRVSELVSFLVDVRQRHGRRRARSKAASPTTTAARACASSASRASRAGCSPP